MTEALSPPDLANSVTGFATIFAGATTWLLCRLVRPQPARWSFVYACIFLTGLPTVGWHGWALESLRIADVGSNLLVAWAVQMAVLGDYYAAATRARVGAASALVNLAGVLWMVRESLTDTHVYVIHLGDFGGFYAAEALLIFDSFLAVGLFYARRDRIPARARPLLWCVTGIFLFGLGLATAAGSTVHYRIASYHALWHLVSAFGFVFLWAFNHVRTEIDPALSPA